ncbi:alanine--tRNA ligase, partial [bacterium]|nr:alanine--tRNA ligase [bacterium]
AALVNAGTPRCIEIWNLVFIQYNADPDGSLSPLPARHVDTGLGFERVCGIIQCTNGLRDFSGTISNYETDVFTPLFRAIEELSGKRYRSTLPGANAVGQASRLSSRPSQTDRQDACPPGEDQIKADIAFRVIADHIRCLSFAIADGIAPSNEGRGYVLRRILRRAVRYGRNLGLHEPFFYKLTDVVAANFGDVFPEVRREQARIRQVLRAEEESFNRTLDRGLALFEQVADGLGARVFPTAEAFKLYDTFGFPLDLTELLARERGLTVDAAGVETLMEEQRRRAREDHRRKKTAVAVVGEGLQVEPTQFLGYDNLEAEAVVEAVLPGPGPGEMDLVLDRTPFYAEMGGQVGDTGLVHVPGHDNSELGRLAVIDTQRQGDVHVHRARVATGRAPEVGEAVRVGVDAERRANIQRHHTATHLFHWALRAVVSPDAQQRGSLVAPDRFRFDFSHPAKLTDQQLTDIEQRVNERIKADEPVSWIEVPFAEVENNPGIQQLFGEKYGDTVRVLQLGGTPGRLDGFSMELCGGTHVRHTGDIGLFRIARESAIAAGIRRVEAACGRFARDLIDQQQQAQAAAAAQERARERQRELAKSQQSAVSGQAPVIAEKLVGQLADGVLVAEVPGATADLLRAVVDALKPNLTSAVVVLGGTADGKVALICYVTPDLVKAGRHAGKIVGALAKLCGGGGGGRPDLAQAGGKDPAKLAAALAAVPGIVGG